MEFQFTGWVCTDCLLIHANGEIGDDSYVPDEEPWGLLEIGTVVTMGQLWEEHDETCPNRAFQSWVAECDCDRIEFSRRACEGCGTHLAGERHAFTFWYEAPVSHADSAGK